MKHAKLMQAHDVSVLRPSDDGANKRVLHQVTMEISSGELLAIVGPSGSGKSTFLRVLNRLIEPEQGRILLSGRDIRKIAPPQLRARVSLVAQKPYLFAGTVQENLEASAKLRRTAPPNFKSKELLQVLNMCSVDASWMNRDARKLSIGEQQRVSLARSLFGPCEVLLLDEPTSSLDRPNADQMAKTFKILAKEKGLGIIVVTHDLRLAEMCADRIALMFEGSILEEGEREQILSQPKQTYTRTFISTIRPNRNRLIS